MRAEQSFEYWNIIEMLVPDDGSEPIVSRDIIAIHFGAVQDGSVVPEQSGVLVEECLHRAVRIVGRKRLRSHSGNGVALSVGPAKKARLGSYPLGGPNDFVPVYLYIGHQGPQTSHCSLALRIRQRNGHGTMLAHVEIRKLCFFLDTEHRTKHRQQRQRH